MGRSPRRLSKHTPFRLDLELERLQRLASQWLEAHTLRRPTDDLDAAIDRATRASRRTESYLRKHPH